MRRARAAVGWAVSAAQASLFGEPPLRAEASQWHTPAWLAKRLAAWVLPKARVIEPSAGAGNLIAPLIERGHDPKLITAIELDQAWADHCRIRFGHKVHVLNEDFLQYSPAPNVFNVALGNFPFEDGLHARFIAHALELAPIVIGIFPVSVEFGGQRDRELWSQKARVVCRARMPERVKYGGDQSASFDSIALKIVRREEGPRRADEIAYVAEECWLQS